MMFFTSGGISGNLSNSLMQPLAAIICSENMRDPVKAKTEFNALNREIY